MCALCLTLQVRDTALFQCIWLTSTQLWFTLKGGQAGRGYKSDIPNLWPTETREIIVSSPLVTHRQQRLIYITAHRPAIYFYAFDWNHGCPCKCAHCDRTLNNQIFADNARSSGAHFNQLSLLWCRLPAIVSPPYSGLVGSTHPLPQANNHCDPRFHDNDCEPPVPLYVLLLRLPTYKR